MSDVREKFDVWETLGVFLDRYVTQDETSPDILYLDEFGWTHDQIHDVVNAAVWRNEDGGLSVEVAAMRLMYAGDISRPVTEVVIRRVAPGEETA